MNKSISATGRLLEELGEGLSFTGKGTDLVFKVCVNLLLEGVNLPLDEAVDVMAKVCFRFLDSGFGGSRLDQLRLVQVILELTLIAHIESVKADQ